MATLDQINTAREKGYSDDEIYTYLGSNDDRFSKAKAAGFSLDEVATYLGQQGGGVQTVALEDETQETKGASLGDMARRVPAGIAEAGADTIAGVLKVAGDVNQDYGDEGNFISRALSNIGRRVHNQEGLLPLEATTQFVKDVSERSKSDYGVDTERDKAFLSKVASGVGSIVPVMASGPAAPATAAAMMGESLRKEAEQYGGTKEQQDKAFYAGTAIGVVSEALLGVPALLRSAKASGIPDATFKSFAQRAAKEAVKGSLREGFQEGPVEQTAQNLVAKYIAEYDPNRPVTQDVVESALVGSVIGAPTATVVSIADSASKLSELPPPKTDLKESTTEAIDTAAQVDEVLAETATSTPPPPVETTAAPTATEAPSTPPPLPSEAIPPPLPEVTPEVVEEAPAEPTPEPVETPVPQPETSPTPEVTPTVDPWQDHPSFVREKLQPLAEEAESDGTADKVVALVQDGKTNKEIASELEVSENVVTAVKINRGLQPKIEKKPSQPKVKTELEKATDAFEKFRKQAIAYAESLGGATDADAAVSDAIKTLSAKVADPNEKEDLSDPKSLLFKAVKWNVGHQRGKEGAQRRGGGKVESLDVEEMESAAVETRGPMSETVSKEDIEEIGKAIQTLNKNEMRVAQVLMRDEGLTDAEIAEELDLAEGTIGNIKMRLNEVLKPYAKMRGFGQGLGPGAASIHEVFAFVKRHKTADAIANNPAFSELFREYMAEDYTDNVYDVIPMNVSQEKIEALIKLRGIDSVLAEAQDMSSDLSLEDRTVALATIAHFFDQQYKANKETHPDIAAAALNKAVEVSQWAMKFGADAGRAINQLKKFHQELTLVSMVEQFFQTNGGVEVNETQIAEITKLHEDIVKTQEDIEKSTDAAVEKDSDNALKEEVEKMKSEERSNDPEVQSLLDRIVAKLDKMEQDARKRLRARLQKAGALVDPGYLSDVAIIGASYIAKGIRNLDAWRKKMMSDPDVGEDLEPYLDDIFQQSNTMLDQVVENGSPTPEKAEKVKRLARNPTNSDIATAIKAKVKDGAKIKDLQSLVRMIARNLIKAGETDAQKIAAETHKIVEPLIPITERQTMDLISGYGDFKQLSKDELDVKERNTRGELRELGKLDDLQKGEKVKKSGVERAPLSDKARRISQKVAELMKKLGYKGSEGTLKGALDAAKTRLKNQIKDIANEIETGERKPGQTQLEYDQEALALKMVRDRMQETLNSLEDKTISEEERIKIVERSLEARITETERLIAGGQKKAKGAPVTSPLIEARQARLEALKAELDEIRSHDAELQEEKTLNRVFNEIDKAEATLAGAPPTPSKVKLPDTDLVTQAKGILSDLREKIKASKEPETQAKKIQAAIEAVEKSIADYDARLQAGDLSTKTGAPQPTSPILEARRAERAAMRDLLNELRREARKLSPAEKAEKARQAEIKSLTKSIEALDKKLQAGDLSTKKTKGPYTDQLIERLNSERDAMQRYMNQLRREARPKLTNDERAVKAMRTRVANQLADVKDKIARGDFTKKERKPLDLSKHPDIVANQAELIKARQQFRKMKLENERKHWSLLRKSLNAIREAFGLPRALFQTIWDYSAVLRQGGFYVSGHPIKAAKALGTMFKAGWSKDLATKEQAKLEQRPNYKNGLYTRDKLALTEVGGELNKQEETLMSDFASRGSEIIEGFMNKLGLPGKIVGRVISQPFRAAEGSQRAYVAILNRFRADNYDALVASLTPTGTPTPEQGKAIATFVNNSTGRGSIGRHDNAAEILSSVFYSPRFVSSRFRLLFEPLTGFSFGGGDASTRKLIATEYARTIAGGMTVLFLAHLAGADIEWDPRSSDFLKIRFGKTRIDPFYGLLQVFGFVYKSISGEKKLQDGTIQSLWNPKPGQKDYGDEIWKFARTKLAPVPGGYIDWMSGKDVMGNEATGKSVLTRMITPMVLGEIPELLKEWGIPKAAYFQLLNVAGASVNVYPDRESKSKKAYVPEYLSK